MKRSLVAAAALLIACGLTSPVLAGDATDSFVHTPFPHPPSVPGPGGSDTVVILVSDTSFGPDSQDADVAARFYCSTRGKLTTFVSKEHPSELRTQVFQQWYTLTYRCVLAATSSAE